MLVYSIHFEKSGVSSWRRRNDLARGAPIHLYTLSPGENPGIFVAPTNKNSNPTSRGNAKRSQLAANANARRRTASGKKNAAGVRMGNPDADPGVRAYEAALMSPFSPMALGAQVPDMYSYPTTTYHTEGTITLVSNASGIASVLLTPQPYFSMVDVSGGSILETGMAPYVASTSCYAAVSLANLSSVLTNCRVVGGGFQVRNLMPPTTCTGRLILAPVPLSGVPPGPKLLGNQVAGVSKVVDIAIGIAPPATGFASSILELPKAKELTMQDLIASTLEFTFHPITAKAFDFCATDDSTDYNSADSMIGNDALTNATGTIIGAHDSLASSSIGLGFDSAAILFTGCPASTTIAEIKYVLHFEGTPSMPSSSTGTLAPAVTPKVIVRPAQHLNILGKVLSRDNVRLATGLAASVAGGGVAGGASFVARTALAKLGLSF